MVDPGHGAPGAALTVAIALAAGMIAQSLARHLRIPGIVLLLGAGIALGPDLTDVVHPDALGGALQILVGFAVAVILFEGGLNLGLARLRSQARVIQRLITVGALVTMAGGTFSARWLMGWDWSLSVLFGSLVVVTGPTVITPLLRRIKVARRVETVLEAEGVLIDAIGAVLAVVTLEVVIGFSGEALAGGVLAVAARLGLGALFGAAGGLAIAFLLRSRKIVPDGFENVLTLSLVLVLFQVSNTLLAESGIISATVAGMFVGNVRTRALRELMEFKEQLTLMFIGLLFVLLAADVRMADVVGLGWHGAATVASLMLIVRPINVWVGTAGSDLGRRERIFLAWLAPRGVVAAAVASLFAQTLDAASIHGGAELRALVFLVIGGTVVIQGLSGGMVARLLGLRRGVSEGFVVLGANELARALGHLMREAGLGVVFVDNNPGSVRAAEEEGFRVVYGNVIEESTLVRAGMDERRGCIALTSNEAVNLLFARQAAEEFQHTEIYVALRQAQTSVDEGIVEREEAQVLFGRRRDLEMWMVRLRRRLAVVERWQLGRPSEPRAGDDEERVDPVAFPESLLVPMLLHRGSSARPLGHAHPPRTDDVVDFLVFTEQREDAERWLERAGWTRVVTAAVEPAEVSADSPR